MKRDGMQVDPRTVSSDGFMINTFSVLMDFSAPFMDPSYSKMDKIDAEYFRKSARLDIEDVTKINASGEEAKEYYHGYKVLEGGESAFILLSSARPLFTILDSSFVAKLYLRNLLLSHLLYALWPLPSF